MKLTSKELRRASTDGFVIISRPNKLFGGYDVLCVRISDLRIIGWQHRVDGKNKIAASATSIQRDLDKFLGVGGKMSASGRHRPGIKENKLRGF
jgi:hypothetical protein